MNCFIYLAESIVQCDQIWQSYASLAESLQYWAIFFGGGYLLFGKMFGTTLQILYASVSVNQQRQLYTQLIILPFLMHLIT